MVGDCLPLHFTPRPAPSSGKEDEADPFGKGTTFIEGDTSCSSPYGYRSERGQGAVPKGDPIGKTTSD